MKLSKKELELFIAAKEANEKATVELAYITMDESDIVARKARYTTNFRVAHEKLKAESAKIHNKYGEGCRVELSTGKIIKPNGTD